VTPASTPRRLTNSQVLALADQLRSLLSHIEGGAMDASTATRYRIEGAVAALDVALGRQSSLLAHLTSPQVDSK
jgi:hypothetical protein